MIHANRIVTVGEQESIIDRPIVLYRGDREVEIEFTLVGNEFTFSEEGNVIKSVNASHGQLVLNTPSGEHMFSELAECHEGKVVFVVTKEMIDEFIEMGFYSFQIRLYDSAEMKSRVTIPPVMNGFDIRNPIAAEDETNVVDQGIVDYARIFKDQSNEELPTFTWDGEYVKTEWVHHDVITENKMNKIEDALYSINANIKESDVVMLNALDNVKKDADKYVKEHMAEVEADVDEFERNLNTDVQQFKIDTNASVERFKIDTNDAMTAHKNEVSEELEGKVNKEDFFINVKEFGIKGDGVTDDTILMQKAIDECCANGRSLYIPKGTYKISNPLKIEYPINITGEAQHLTILSCSNGCFEISKENAIIGLCISNMTLKGNNTGNGISIGKINNVRLADSRFSHIRIERFAVGIQSQYAWCNTYDSIRVHGCAQPFAFDSQTNCSHFNTCSFSSFSITGTFKNCEGLVFTDCNIVNMNNNVGFTLYQSTITFNSPYFENVQNILCTIGATSEKSNSRLMLNGGIITGNIQLGNDKSVLTINESEMTPNVVKIMNAYENTTPSVYTNSVRININDLEFTPALNNNTLFSYDYRTQLKQRCISSGALVPTTFHNGFSRCTMNSSTDGMLIHANIVAGEQYTLVYAIRKGENYIDAKLHQGERKLPFPLQEAGEAFELRHMYFIGSDVTHLMRLYFNGDIEIAYLKLYKGIRNSIDELPIYLERYNSTFPTEGTWTKGDRIVNNSPSQGVSKSWVCTASGTPGTWVSEGIL